MWLSKRPAENSCQNNETPPAHVFLRLQTSRYRIYNMYNGESAGGTDPAIRIGEIYR